MKVNIAFGSLKIWCSIFRTDIIFLLGYRRLYSKYGLGHNIGFGGNISWFGDGGEITVTLELGLPYIHISVRKKQIGEK